MREFVRTHKRKLLIGHTIVAAFVLTTVASFSASRATLYFSPQGSSTLYTGEIMALDVAINAPLPINAIDATVTYPDEFIEIVGEGKQDSFLDLWPREEHLPVADGVGAFHFAGGTVLRGGFMGTGTVLTLNVRAKKAGTAAFELKDVLVLASDGKGTEVPTVVHPFSLMIVEKTVARPAGGGAAAAPESPSPDLDGDGSVTLIDASIFLVRMIFPYDPRSDLDADGSVGVSDFSLLLSKFRM